MTKHCMVGAPNLRQSKKKNTQPLVVMVDTFRMSAFRLHELLQNHEQS